MRFRACALIVIALVFGTLANAEDEAGIRFEQVMKKMVRAINAEDYPAIQQDFGEIMLREFPLEQYKPFFKNLTARYGKIEKLEGPRLIPPDQAIFPALFQRGKLDIKIVLDDGDKITGLWFLPHTPPSVPVLEEHETELSLPFRGDWMVLWGGDTKQMNQHHDVPNQRYAFDFLVADANDKTYKGEGKANEDYCAFGKEVLSPGDGIVTDVISGVRDNVPGSMNPYSALGNAVVIVHRQHEISVLTHLKKGSIKVKAGDEVRRGQVIALCGNSGNSSEPHLHYHLQNTPVIQDGTGIKCFFENVILTRDGKSESRARYSPVRGDVLRGGAE